jgi:hypothetical protein
MRKLMVVIGAGFCLIALLDLFDRKGDWIRFAGYVCFGLGFGLGGSARWDESQARLALRVGLLLAGGVTLLLHAILRFF